MAITLNMSGMNGVQRVECDCGCTIEQVRGYWLRDSSRCETKHMEGVMPEATEVSGMKPGYKSSEFYLSAAAFILGALMASGVIAEGSAVAQAIGIAASALAAMGYSWSRGAAKKPAG